MTVIGDKLGFSTDVGMNLNQNYATYCTKNSMETEISI